jgi:hypothetical protein
VVAAAAAGPDADLAAADAAAAEHLCRQALRLIYASRCPAASSIFALKRNKAKQNSSQFFHFF